VSLPTSCFVRLFNIPPLQGRRGRSGKSGIGSHPSPPSYVDVVCFVPKSHTTYAEALQTYVTTLAFYYYLRLSPKYIAKPDLLASHPILSRLLTLKQALSSLEDLNFNVSDSNSEFDEDEDEDMDMLFGKRGSIVDAEELEALKLEAEAGFEEESNPAPKKRRTKVKKDKSKKRPVQPTFDLEEPTFTPTRSSTKALSGDTNTFGEATSIEHSDATDKKARKRSLQFHTSKIAGASARRQGARLNALGGDDDIPYQERKKDKDIKLRARSGLGEGGDDLDGDDGGFHSSIKFALA